LIVEGTLVSGTGTAGAWSDELNRLLGDALGVMFVSGTFNIQLPCAIVWDSPLALQGGTHPWELCPIVLQDRAIGLAFRGNTDRPDLLEIVAPIEIRNRLGGMQSGATVTGRLLPGSRIPLK